MKIKMNKKVMIAIFFSLIMLAGAFVAIEQGASPEISGSPASVQSNYTFPYEYGTPKIPSNVGAHDSGLTVPRSDIGNHEANGSSILPITCSGTPISVSFKVMNGTVSSNSIAVGVPVELFNMTTGIGIKVNTTNGYANFSIDAGRYYVETFPSSSYTPFIYVYDFVASESLSIYDIPESLAKVDVNNGGTQNVTVSANFPQEPVYLYNESSSSIIACAYANASMGSRSFEVEFENLSSNYTYYAGNNNISKATDVNYYIDKVTSGTFNTTISAYFSGSSGISSLNGTLTGSKPTEYGWSITSNTTISNATIILSSTPSMNSDLTLSISNSVLVLNYTQDYGQWWGDKDHVYINNTKIIFSEFPLYDDYNSLESIENLSMNNDKIIGELYENKSLYGNVLDIAFFSGDNDKMDNTSVLGIESIGIGSINTLNAYNDYIQNSSIGGIRYGQYITFDNVSFNFESSSQTYLNSLFIGMDTSGYPGGVYDNGTDTFMYDTFENGIMGLGIQGMTNITFQHNTYLISYPEKSFAYFNQTSKQYLKDFQSTHLISDGDPANISYNYFGLQFVPFFGSVKIGNAIFYDNIVNNNITFQELNTYSSDARYSDGYPMIGYGIVGNIRGNNFIDYSHNLFYNDTPGGEAASPPSADNVTYANNMFYTMISFEAGIMLGIATKMIENNTFYDMCVNNTVQLNTDSYANNVINVADLDGGTVQYNTFYYLLTADANSGSASGNWILSNTPSLVRDNVFYNDRTTPPVFNTKQVGVDVSLYAYVESTDNNTTTIEDNYFLNLNNGTLPYADHGVNLTLSGNHYYYSPAYNFTAYVTNTTFNQQNDKISYATILGAHLTINDSQYIFNTTQKGTDSYIYYGFSGTYYLWNITPDVVIHSDAPVISYYNGLVGGPQPNFEWKGYDYTESVEKDYIKIGVNSSSAPNVTLSFKATPGELYDVNMVNGNNTTLVEQVLSNNGYINVTYNPAKMPLDPTFSVSPVTCVVAPAPPPLPPGGPVQVISHPFKYFDYSIWTILMWIGIAAAIAGVAYVILRRL